MTYPAHNSLEVDVSHIYCKATIGSSGAPTLVAASSKGVASIARSDTGDYTITLDEKYNSLLFGSAIMLESDDTDLQIQLAAEDVSSAKTIQFICTAAATPADPPDGSTLYFKFELKNSSV
jgi:hypothetical protein